MLVALLEFLSVFKRSTATFPLDLRARKGGKEGGRNDEKGGGRDVQPPSHARGISVPVPGLGAPPHTTVFILQLSERVLLFLILQRSKAEVQRSRASLSTL